MTGSFGSPSVQRMASHGFSPDSLVLSGGFSLMGCQTDWSVRGYASWWFFHILERQDDGDLPDVGRLRGREAEFFIFFK